MKRLFFNTLLVGGIAVSVLKSLGISILVLSLLLVLVGCGADDNSTLISDINEIDIELEPTPYASSDLPEILKSSDLGLRKYKMSVGEAFICRGEYIYFQRRIDSNNNDMVDDQDNKIRIYLDPPIESEVGVYTTFGTLLTEYNHRVTIEITDEIVISERDRDLLPDPCANDIDALRDGKPKKPNSDSISGLYIGRLISIFE